MLWVINNKIFSKGSQTYCCHSVLWKSLLIQLQLFYHVFYHFLQEQYEHSVSFNACFLGLLHCRKSFWALPIHLCFDFVCNLLQIIKSAFGVHTPLGYYYMTLMYSKWKSISYITQCCQNDSCLHGSAKTTSWQCHFVKRHYAPATHTYQLNT